MSTGQKRWLSWVVNGMRREINQALGCEKTVVLGIGGNSCEITLKGRLGPNYVFMGDTKLDFMTIDSH